ncbi:helix-turn-helix domain-containing protein [Mucilaginibacter pallidiroseus]|uniref:Helix-turn-helix domain-containing protein n=1 Tax=Mucilaginibacter pallidiroseus TaxID=2599295 RepID=A0A563U137_9SPHI|nr:AraC family transcriptional regulator [Mucilaginibacter pallidiroseus]TWR25110.1 helix-turn-helix domain-containing protein [Mucilaginibacter pallidiroseus]
MKVLQFTIPVADDKSVIAEQVDLPHHYPYLHRHKETQITWIQEGEGTLIAGNHMHSYGPGDIFLLGANMPHLFKSNDEYYLPESTLRVKAISIFFNPDGLLSATFNLPEMKAIKTFIGQHAQGFKIPSRYSSLISAAMEATEQAKGTDQLICFLELLKQLQQISNRLDALSGYSNMPAITEDEGIRIGNIYNYLMQNYSGTVKLEDVARTAFMTPESFCRYFKKHTGHTFVSFLNEIRVNEACKKLTEHKAENISDIAYRCGFKSINNFNRVFKSIMGYTPREYFANYRNSIKSL